ncbi:nuclear transport factor 2 family protein [Streptomyces sp. AC627_RSS907]|uniref:nuclear transport factor 2 family protein n=1 Tax=Streptomyces sp. AC627_RSS907 TaxID=2823684 RepID=UPI001C243511|nr:nuclear transport factor 2 family protein [Streptomyces sp. AC627_RSS907]
MTSHAVTNTDTGTGALVRALYGCLAEGDIDGLLNGLHEDIQWVVPPGLHYGGTYRGRDAVLNNVFARFTTEWAGFAVQPAELVATDDTVVALGHYSGTNLSTGKPMRTRFAHVWRFENGVPVHFETIPDTHTMTRAM